MKPKIKKQLKTLALASITVIAAGIIISVLLGGSFTGSLKNVFSFIVYSLLIGLSLAYGNGFVSSYITKKHLSWIDKPRSSLLMAFLGIFIFSTIDVIIVNYIWGVWVLGIKFSVVFSYWIPTMMSEIIVSVFIATFLYASSFLKNWKNTFLNQEQLKQEAIALKYETLKNQVNPHFLFNSFNVLTNLVNTDKDLAVKFIKQMSDTYRYILDQKNKELVDLETEMKFIQSYLYIQQCRFPDKLITDIHLPEIYNYKIIPLSLQILIENTIKHNEISNEKPLKISIFIDENENLIVKNNLQIKTAIEESTQIGLSNLKSRYEYLTGKDFIIENNNKEFIVKLPLIKS